MDILLHMIWIFSHLANDSNNIKNIILSSPIFKSIIEILKEQTIKNDILKIVCWFFGNLAKGHAGSSLQVNIF